MRQWTADKYSLPGLHEEEMMSRVQTDRLILALHHCNMCCVCAANRIPAYTLCKEFHVNGQPFLQYVEDQWNHHRMEKEREKQERKMKQTEEDLLYGTIIRTPAKRRLARTPTPGKTRKLNSTHNRTLRSTSSSPSMRPPLSSSKLGVRTPAHGRSPRGLERNKGNTSHLSGASPQRNYSITSVASSSSEFAREHSNDTKSNNGLMETKLLMNVN